MGADVKVICGECDWHGTRNDLLEAHNPFDDSDIIEGCPQCKKDRFEKLERELTALQQENAELKADNGRAYSALALAAEEDAGNQQREMELRDEIEELKRQVAEKDGEVFEAINVLHDLVFQIHKCRVSATPINIYADPEAVSLKMAQEVLDKQVTRNKPPWPHYSA